MLNILFFVAFQSFVLVFLLFLNKKDKKEDYYLMSFFGIVFLHIVFKMALSYFFNDLVFNKVHASFSLLYGPVLYFFYASAYGIELTNKKVFLHTLPFLFSSVVNIGMLIHLFFFEENDQWVEIYDIFSMMLFVPSLLLYSLFCLKKIAFSFDFKDETIIGLRNKMIQLLSYMLLFSGFLAVLGLFFTIIHFESILNLRYFYYGFLLVIMITTLNYRIKLTHKFQLSNEEGNVIEKAKEKYKNYDLNEDEMDAIINKINHSFESQKVYLNPDFSLDLLSQNINIPKIKITQALNIKLDSNFYNYLNYFRIEESKRLIKKSKNSSLIDISIESGFKNKSTFYKNFKLLNGITPKEYQKNLLLNFV
ncbi:helix-turn-helix domain-containing protein [Flavobacterium sp. ST-87]|uniref:Helix-turn-helix domain-containing protein n=1 Tax=Flavobacterium plantiphilum TaxID=3163297 RepID=A0ABW8XR21_9FLAO